MGAMTMSDGLFVQLAINMKCHFRILQRNIREAEFIYKGENAALLKSFIMKHAELIEICKELNNVFTPIMFPVSVIISSLTGMVAYLLANEFTLINIIVNVGYLAIVLMQLFFYCYGSQAITNEVRFNYYFEIVFYFSFILELFNFNLDTGMQVL